MKKGAAFIKFGMTWQEVLRRALLGRPVKLDLSANEFGGAVKLPSRPMRKVRSE